jgi:hypothetical protein
MKSCGVCALGCSAFRGSDRFTVTKSVQKGRGIGLSQRDLPVISALVAIRQGQAKIPKRRRLLKGGRDTFVGSIHIKIPFGHASHFARYGNYESLPILTD